MIKIKNLLVRNFMSVGNISQAIEFDKGQLTLVLGENLDVGGDTAGSGNGTGKTTIINALSYVLYGNALTNIKRDNLINKINGKGMLVSLTFEKNNVEYRVERGRKPNVLNFSVNGKDYINSDTSESQGDSRETQKAIEDVLSLSHDMFKHIVALNTYNEPFLSMKAADQRSIIEQLLGITQLSTKSESLKEHIRNTKEKISTENTKIETIKISNEKIQQSIESLERKKKIWNDTKKKDIVDLEKSISVLSSIDIDIEIKNQKALIEWNNKNSAINRITATLAKQQSQINKEQTILDKLTQEFALLENHTCHSCGQQIHDDQHTEMINLKTQQIQECQQAIAEYTNEINELTTQLSALGELDSPPSIEYDTLENALNHKNTLTNLKQSLESIKLETNPYHEQIKELEKTALQEINWDTINELTKLKEHQEFLYKLLTNKDSFIRKRIIDQNLNFLNQRLTFYLDKIGLPHVVEFQNDLSVTITQLGQDLDFDNLSRGERNRLILSLSWAFRDIWESLYSFINLLFVDELIDSGLDSLGIEQALGILKKMSYDSGKNIFLISHRSDLTNRVNQVLKVTKENGFTSYSNDMEVLN